METGLPHGYLLKGKSQQYTIERALGQGSFGISYLAKYKMPISGPLGSGYGWVQVCIKEFFMRGMNSRDEVTGFLLDTSGNTLVEKYRRAFLREGRNLARMKNPGIVSVFDVIETNNTAYLVMEYIDGMNLDEYIQSRGRLPEDEALCCFRQICNALAYMHSQKMLHLDLKPKNVMHDEEGHLYLIDFGLSKQFTSDGEPESSTTIGLGTPGYAPVEQAKQYSGDRAFRATIDIYAAGATLFKMLTGQTPPEAIEVSEAIIDGSDLIGKTLQSVGITRRISALCSHAMFPSSKKRYQTVNELMKDFGWEVHDYVREVEVLAIGHESEDKRMEEDETTTDYGNIRISDSEPQTDKPLESKQKSGRGFQKRLLHLATHPYSFKGSDTLLESFFSLLTIMVLGLLLGMVDSLLPMYSIGFSDYFLFLLELVCLCSLLWVFVSQCARSCRSFFSKRCSVFRQVSIKRMLLNGMLFAVILFTDAMVFLRCCIVFIERCDRWFF